MTFNNLNFDTKISVQQAKTITTTTSYSDEHYIFFDHITGDLFSPNKKSIECLFVIFCQEGGITFNWEEKLLTAKKDDLIVLFSDQVFACKKTFCNFKGKAFLATPNFVQKLAYKYLTNFELNKNLSTKPIISLEEQDCSFFMSYFNHTINFLKNKEKYSTETITSNIGTIFNELILKSKPTYSLIQNPSHKKQEQTAKALKAIIDNKFHRNNIKKCCQHLKEKESYASKCFFRCYNIHPAQYILYKKLHHATLLLSKSEKSINYIAQTSGYKSSSSFCRIFKKEIGFTPLAFKNLEFEQQQSIIHHTIPVQISQ